jgi:thioredoxin reductase
MGDGSDYTDIMRFMMSKEGKAHLNTIRKSILGNTVSSVRFENNTSNIKTVLQFDNGMKFLCIQTCHDVTVLRELFEGVIERESVDAGGRGR